MRAFVAVVFWLGLNALTLDVNLMESPPSPSLYNLWTRLSLSYVIYVSLILSKAFWI